nr:biotin transport regulator [Sinorhizobium meliloti]
MQIENRLNAAAASGDGLGNLAGRSADPTGAADKGESGVPVPPTGFVDPTPRISLSADALLYLGRAKRTPEKLPPLTKDEWNNRLSPQLAAREHQAFGRLAETGDYRAYYRAFIDYYDGLRPEGSEQPALFRDARTAVAGLRSLDYDADSGLHGCRIREPGQRLSRGRQDCPFAGHNHDVAGRARLFRLGCVQHQL